MTTPDIPDLCRRLRRAGLKSSIEAAPILERQAAQIERLRDALWPFAQVKPTAAKGFVNICALNVDVIAARAALTGEGT
jgi:hypothetical protein